MEPVVETKLDIVEFLLGEAMEVISFAVFTVLVVAVRLLSWEALGHAYKFVRLVRPIDLAKLVDTTLGSKADILKREGDVVEVRHISVIGPEVVGIKGKRLLVERTVCTRRDKWLTSVLIVGLGRLDAEASVHVERLILLLVDLSIVEVEGDDVVGVGGCEVPELSLCILLLPDEGYPVVVGLVLEDLNGERIVVVAIRCLGGFVLQNGLPCYVSSCKVEA